MDIKYRQVCTNKRKSIIVLELSDIHSNHKTINDLLEINSLGDLQSTFYTIITGDTKLGLIYPVSLDVEPEELLNLMKIERLKKRQDTQNHIFWKCLT